MLNKKEVAVITLSAIILAFVVSILQGVEVFGYTLLAIFLVICANVFAKKVASYYLELEIEMRLWEMSRYGWKAHHHFKKPIPAGAIIPLFFMVISAGYFKWLASLVFEVKPKVYRAAKRHGLYKFSEVAEWHIGLIAAAGILTNVFLAIVGYLVGYSEFAQLNVYYALFNVLPISDLDGNKIFFGSLVLWSFIASVVLLGVFFAIFMI